MHHPSHEFIECIQDCFLYQHIENSTHYRALQRANILDLVLTNEEGMVTNLVYNEPIGKSHHVVLDWNTNLYTTRALQTDKRYCYERGNYDEMRAMLGKINWQETLCDKSVEEMWNLIHGHILEAVHKNVPANKAQGSNNIVSHKKPLWMNEIVLAKLRKKKSAYSRYLETRDGRDNLEYVKIRNI